MARKLKAYVTSIGFYDLAVAAPSMKAALEAWGANQNLFHQGLAKETQDISIVTATLEKPGVVLRRAVGTSRPYQEQAAPPDSLPARAQRRKPATKTVVPAKHKAKPDPKAQKAAIISFEQALARREKARRKDEAAWAKEQAAENREQQATDKAKAALERARQRHKEKIEALDRKRRAVETALAAEQERWRRAEKQLDHDIRNADA